MRRGSITKYKQNNNKRMTNLNMKVGLEVDKEIVLILKILLNNSLITTRRLQEESNYSKRQINYRINKIFVSREDFSDISVKLTAVAARI